MAAALSGMFTSYRQKIPDQIPQSAAKSFALASAYYLITGTPVRTAMLLGGLSVIALVVEAIVRPIFHALIELMISTYYSTGIGAKEFEDNVKILTSSLVSLGILTSLSRRLQSK